MLDKVTEEKKLESRKMARFSTALASGASGIVALLTLLAQNPTEAEYQESYQNRFNQAVKEQITEHAGSVQQNILNEVKATDLQALSGEKTYAANITVDFDTAAVQAKEKADAYFDGMKQSRKNQGTLFGIMAVAFAMGAVGSHMRVKEQQNKMNNTPAP